MSKRSNRRFWTSKYLPHQNKHECRRRLRQIRWGLLQGDTGFIPMNTRYAASGLYAGTITEKHQLPRL